MQSVKLSLSRIAARLRDLCAALWESNAPPDDEAIRSGLAHIQDDADWYRSAGEWKSDDDRPYFLLVIPLVALAVLAVLAVVYLLLPWGT